MEGTVHGSTSHLSKHCQRHPGEIGSSCYFSVKSTFFKVLTPIHLAVWDNSTEVDWPESGNLKRSISEKEPSYLDGMISSCIEALLLLCTVAPVGWVLYKRFMIKPLMKKPNVNGIFLYIARYATELPIAIQMDRKTCAHIASSCPLWGLVTAAMMVVEVHVKISFFHFHHTEGKLDSFCYPKIVPKNSKFNRAS